MEVAALAEIEGSFKGIRKEKTHPGSIFLESQHLEGRGQMITCKFMAKLVSSRSAMATHCDPV